MSTTYECQKCRQKLVYDGPLPEHRLNHRREASGSCDGALWEICPGCQKPEPNVGPWNDRKNPDAPKRLCGSCKLRAWATPTNVKRLESEIQAAVNHLEGKV